MFFGRSGYGYRSYSFPNPLYLLPSLERDYKYILLYIYNLYIYYLQSVSPRKALYPLHENCNFCNRNFCNRNHCNHLCNPPDTFLRRAGNHHIFSTFIRKPYLHDCPAQLQHERGCIRQGENPPSCAVVRYCHGDGNNGAVGRGNSAAETREIDYRYHRHEFSFTVPHTP